MSDSILRILMAIAALFCSLDAPALAHAFDGPEAHATIGLDHEFASEDGGGDSRSSTPDHAVHHHCVGEVLSRVPGIADVSVRERPDLYPQIAPVLASRSQAPPLQPPSA